MKIRLYIPELLAAEKHLQLSKSQHHYLYNVMRSKEDSQIKVFNAEYGEWAATIVSMDKRACYLRIDDMLRIPEQPGSLILAFAPTKNSTVGRIVQQATELGVTEIAPVITARSVVDKVNVDKLKSVAIEAAEQSNRLAVPSIHEIRSLNKVLDKYKNMVLFCDESGKGAKFKDLNDLKKLNQSECMIVIGPEGGFTEEERNTLNKMDNVISISLGGKILRTETATISAIATFQALYGDWS